ncbi:DUF2637 domain-containing protein [Nonomuraea sp. NPDC052129]|uniref:DUF2637 domain-containing protein n=1 Tax=Nonomuraea sp. NPDC052129 TaxID=3154651 RepID=UPI003445A81A
MVEPSILAVRNIQRTTIGGVVLLAGIAAIVSFRHMHELCLRHGEDHLAAVRHNEQDVQQSAVGGHLIAQQREGGEGPPITAVTRMMVFLLLQNPYSSAIGRLNGNPMIAAFAASGLREQAVGGDADADEQQDHADGHLGRHGHAGKVIAHVMGHEVARQL